MLPTRSLAHRLVRLGVWHWANERSSSGSVTAVGGGREPALGHRTSRCSWLPSSGLCGLPVQTLDACCQVKERTARSLQTGGGRARGRSPSPRCLQGPDLREAGTLEVRLEQRLEGDRSLRCEGVGVGATISGHVAAIVPASAACWCSSRPALPLSRVTGFLLTSPT